MSKSACYYIEQTEEELKALKEKVADLNEELVALRHDLIMRISTLEQKNKCTKQH